MVQQYWWIDRLIWPARDHINNQRNCLMVQPKGKYWCRGCDRDLVPDWNDKPKKKQARQKSKKQIRKDLKDLGK